MKVGCPQIDIKFTDRLLCYNAFDAYHIKHDLSAVEKLFFKYGYVSEDNSRIGTMSQGS